MYQVQVIKLVRYYCTVLYCYYRITRFVKGSCIHYVQLRCCSATIILTIYTLLLLLLLRVPSFLTENAPRAQQTTTVQLNSTVVVVRVVAVQHYDSTGVQQEYPNSSSTDNCGTTTDSYDSLLYFCTDLQGVARVCSNKAISDFSNT